MVAPLLVAGGVAIGSAIAQYMSSEQARKANAKELSRLRDMLDKVQDPTFDYSQITPEEFKVVEKYIPEVAQHVAEKRPQIVEETAAMGEGRSAQLDALRRYRDIARADTIDPALAAQLDLASRRGQAEAQSRQESALLGAQRRGQGGSLASLAAQLQGGSAAMDRQAEMGRQAAIEAYRGKLDAMRQSAALGGDIRGQDISLQRSNADIINAYNERASSRLQDYYKRAADTRNQAQMANIRAAQAASDANISQRNRYATAERDRGDELRQREYDNKLRKLGIYSGQSQAAQQAYIQAAQDRNQLYQVPANIAASYADKQEARDLAKMKYGQKDDEGGIF